MLRVALTGGIAAGKSLVAAQFQQLGVPVVDADDAARAVVEPGTPGLAAVVEAFGPEVRGTAGALDRAALRRRLFDDGEARGRLEAILHPRIRDHMAAEFAHHEAAGHAYALGVIPLLVETGQADGYARVLVVDAPEAVQLARLQGRDGLSEADARAALASQTDRETRLKAATEVVTNADDAAPTGVIAPQVAMLDRQYRQLAGQDPATD
jgi:dephospho-CoA kinase